MTKLTSLLLYN